MPDTTLAERARGYEAKTEARLKSAFLPPDAKMMIAEAAALLVAMAIEIEQMTSFEDEGMTSFADEGMADYIDALAAHEGN